MSYLQPQPAGLPSGSFGRSRHRRVAAAVPAPAAHAWPMLLACAALLASGAWLAAVLLVGGGPSGGVAVEVGGAAPGWVLPPALAMALVPAASVLPPLVVALLFGAGPRLMGVVAAPARWLALPVALMAAGSLALLAGVHAARPLAGLGMAVSAVGLALAGVLWALLAAASPRRQRPGAALAAGGVLALAAALWLAALLVLTGWTAALLPLGAAALLAGVALPLAVLTWRLLALARRAADVVGGPLPRMARIARLGLAWAAVALLLAVAAAVSALVGDAGPDRPGLAALPAGWALWAGVALASLGAAGSGVQAVGGWLLRTAAGRRADLDQWGLWMALALQVAALAACGALLWPAGRTGLGWLALQFGAVASVSWALRHGRWLLRATAAGPADRG